MEATKCKKCGGRPRRNQVCQTCKNSGWVYVDRDGDGDGKAVVTPAPAPKEVRS